MISEKSLPAFAKRGKKVFSAVIFSALVAFSLYHASHFLKHPGFFLHRVEGTFILFLKNLDVFQCRSLSPIASYMKVRYKEIRRGELREEELGEVTHCFRALPVAPADAYRNP